MSQPLPEVLNAVVLGPEDRLVLVFQNDITEDEVDWIRKRLAELDLAARVLITAGVEQLAVLRGADSLGSPAASCPP